MTEAELRSIEDALAIALPNMYREVMRNYPFALDSFANDCEIPNDPTRIIQKNKELRVNGFFGRPWPNHFFAFGDDGGGNEHYLDLRNDPSPVFLADHEGSEDYKLASDLATWVADRKLEYAAWDEEDRLRAERRQNRKWWQFWIR